MELSRCKRDLRLAPGRLRKERLTLAGAAGWSLLHFLMPTLRIAIPADLPAIVAISNQAIAARNATADTTPFTVEVRLDWFTAHSADEYPIYVCGADDG